MDSFEGIQNTQNDAASDEAARAKIALDLANAEKTREEALQIRRQGSWLTIGLKALVSAIVGLGTLSFFYEKVFLPLSSVEKEKSDVQVQKAEFSLAKAKQAENEAQEKQKLLQKGNEDLQRANANFQKQIDDAKSTLQTFKDDKVNLDVTNKKVSALEAQLREKDKQGSGAIHDLEAKLVEAKREAAEAAKKVVATGASKGTESCATISHELFPWTYDASLKGDASKIVETAMNDMHQLSPQDFAMLSSAQLAGARKDSAAPPDETPVAKISILWSHDVYVTDRGVRFKSSDGQQLLAYEEMKPGDLKVEGSYDLAFSPKHKVSFAGTSVHRSTLIFELRNILLLRSACLAN